MEMAGGKNAVRSKETGQIINGVYALKGLDLSLKEGEIHGLVGENGAGKSTFIKILGGVYTKTEGSCPGTELLFLLISAR